MKNFANCNPEEFMTQAVKLRGPFIKWIEEVGVKEIRARRPEGFDNMSQKEKAEAASKLGMENMGEILATALEQQPELTKQVMCLCTFTEINDFNSHLMVEYLDAITEMLASAQVRSFFTFFLAPKMKNISRG